MDGAETATILPASPALPCIKHVKYGYSSGFALCHVLLPLPGRRFIGAGALTAALCATELTQALELCGVNLLSAQSSLL